MRIIYGLLLALTLVGCDTTADLAERHQDEAACRSHVRNGGPSTYEQCIAEMKIAKAYIATHTPGDPNAVAAIAAATAANSNQVWAPTPVQPLPSILPPPPVRCRSVGVGNAIQTVCQ